MNSVLLVVMTAVALSMDAFSVSLSFGTLNLRKRRMLFLSIIVGIFHFVMPLLGMVLGETVNEKLIILPKTLTAIIFIIIGIQMFLSIFSKESNFTIAKTSGLLLFGIAVSLDSFCAGIGLGAQGMNLLFVLLCFSIVSATFTLVGCILGKLVHEVFGKVSTIIGGIILILLGLSYL